MIHLAHKISHHLIDKLRRNKNSRIFFLVGMANVVKDAHKACYLSIPDGSGEYPAWIIGVERFQEAGAEVPDISIDPDDGTLSVINVSNSPRSYFVTVENCAAIIDGVGTDIVKQCNRDYVTFVVLVNGGYILDLVQLVPKGPRKRFSQNLPSISVSSDIQDYVPLELRPPVSAPIDIDQFPLKSDGLTNSQFLCTQGEGGALTHFAHAGTFYAVGFRCPISTPIVAVFRGKVKYIRNDTMESGVHVRHLFVWNSVMIESLDGSYFAEYVHVQKDSFQVSVGDVVEKGTVLCLSGDSGFCPEPHLHFEVHCSDKPDSPSIPILYRGNKFSAGEYYS